MIVPNRKPLTRAETMSEICDYSNDPRMQKKLI